MAAAEYRNANDVAAITARWRFMRSTMQPGLFSMTEKIAYKVLTADERAALEGGSFKGAPIDLADGFIHLSTASQLAGTVDRHFAGRDNLSIAAIDLEALGPAVRWELSRGGELFPHVYAPLAAAVVIAVEPLERAADGTVRLPRAASPGSL